MLEQIAPSAEYARAECQIRAHWVWYNQEPIEIAVICGFSIRALIFSFFSVPFSRFLPLSPLSKVSSAAKHACACACVCICVCGGVCLHAGCGVVVVHGWDRMGTGVCVPFFSELQVPQKPNKAAGCGLGGACMAYTSKVVCRLVCCISDHACKATHTSLKTCCCFLNRPTEHPPQPDRDRTYHRTYHTSMSTPRLFFACAYHQNMNFHISHHEASPQVRLYSRRALFKYSDTARSPQLQSTSTIESTQYQLR